MSDERTTHTGTAMTERMCPYGNCKATWSQAVSDLMHGPAAMSRDQAEALLERTAIDRKNRSAKR